MVQILATADWQIGMKAASVADAAARVRKARIEAAGEVVKLANRLQPDALILAGDTFEDNQVPDRLAQKVIEILRLSQVPVYILPGNHDPWGHDSILRRLENRLPSHVHLLKEPGPVPLPDAHATLLPCPVTSRRSRQDPTEAIPPRTPEQGVRIGVAHGSLKIEGKYQDDDFPIPLDAPKRRDLDFLILGHWHSYYPYPSTEAPTILYPGTHEQTKFAEKKAGQASLLQIEPNEPVKIDIFPTGTLRWKKIAAPIEQAGDLERLERQLRGLPTPEKTLVSIELAGATSLALLESLRHFREEVAPELGFLHLRFEGEIKEEATPEELEAMAKSPLLGRIVSDLQADLELGGPKAEVARQALRTLWSIKEKLSCGSGR